MPEGTTYYYYDPLMQFQQSAYSLNDTLQGAMTHTMSQLWMPGMNYIIYNDETPFQTTYNYSVAHSKAVWMWDEESAILITHSIPKFPQGPSLKDTYTGLMENAWEYGQSAACIPVSLQSLPNVLSLIETTVPNIYDMSATLSYNLPQKTSEIIIDGTYIYTAKTPTAHIDIWTYIGQQFGVNVRVESWIHGEMDGPYCPPAYNTTTLDISSLTFPEGQQFVEYDDHSKWGIDSTTLFCIGDMNRVTSQMSRGGGVYCWKDSQLWTHLNQAIQATNQC